jgi:hypothetical protein
MLMLCASHQSKVAELEERWACCCDERVGWLDVTIHNLVVVAAAHETGWHRFTASILCISEAEIYCRVR